MPPSVPLVSVLVPLRGEPLEVVLATLDSLRRLDHPAYEVIVVGGRDDTQVAAYCSSTGLRFVLSGPSRNRLDDGIAAMHAESAVMLMVAAGEPVERDLLAGLRDVRPSAPAFVATTGAAATAMKDPWPTTHSARSSALRHQRASRPS